MRRLDDKDYPAVTRANLANARPAFSRTMRIALVGGALAMLTACGGSERPRTELAAAQLNTIGVNAFLWRAALDTVSFAPLLQADSMGGVIVTDWYANPANPNERVKLTVTILDQDLRADALRVAASRQVSEGGNWVEAPVQAATVQKLEDIILTKARDLRRQALAS
jgi:alpha-beta hydrolase superfamily lysophospholipase